MPEVVAAAYVQLDHVGPIRSAAINLATHGINVRGEPMRFRYKRGVGILGCHRARSLEVDFRQHQGYANDGQDAA